MLKFSKLNLGISLCLLLLLSACGGRSASTTYYILDSGETTPVVALTDTKQLDTLPKLVLSKVEMPSYLERNSIVTREANGVQLHIASFESWAEGLESGARRVVAEVLTPLLLKEKIVLQQLDDNSLDPWQIYIQVQRFDGPLGQNVVLDARWTVRSSNDIVLISGAFVDKEPAGLTYTSMVQAQSNLLKKLAKSMVAPIASAVNEN